MAHQQNESRLATLKNKLNMLKCNHFRTPKPKSSETSMNKSDVMLDPKEELMI